MTIRRVPLLLSWGLLAAVGRAAPSPPGPAAGGTATLPLAECAASMNDQLPTPTPSDFNFSGSIRRYYVAAEEVEWDYAPSGWDNWLGVPLEVSPRAQRAGADRFGTRWLKGLYRGYTDSSFTQRTPQPPWQGTQGPTLRAEVGDLIEILFVNRLTSAYATMHSMGLHYAKWSEGSNYANNTVPGQNVVLPESESVPPARPGLPPGIPPGGCVVYKWLVDDGSGPPAGEPAKVHSYHSYVSLQEDSNAGLLGPSIIYARGQMNATMARYREFTLLYMIYNEADSWLSCQNRARLDAAGHGNNPRAGFAAQDPPGGPVGGGAPGSAVGVANNRENDGSCAAAGQVPELWQGNETVWRPQLTNLQQARHFPGAPRFPTMNGYIFSNNPRFEACLNDEVIWYVNAFGSASHVFHMHGNGFSYHGFDEYAISLNDGEGKTLYMNATNGGNWQVICHVDSHLSTGMESNYQVYYQGECPLPPSGNSNLGV